jgi:hypothetical protein
MNTSAKVFRIGARRKHRLELVVVLVLAAPVIMLGATAFHWEMLGEPVLLATIVLIAIVVGLGAWAHIRYVKTARLSIDDGGMKLESEIPRFLAGGYQGPWEIRWDEVDRVSLVDWLGLLQIRRKGFARMWLALKLNDWTPEDAQGSPASGPTGPTADVRSTALWQELARRGLFTGHKSDPRVEALNFDLAKHPATKWALMVMAGLAAYWAIDGFFAHEAWAEWRAKYIVPHVVAGIVGAVVATFALKAARTPSPVPINIVMPLALLLGFTVALATWTGLIRVNQLVGGPLEEEPYVRNEACDKLLPIKQGLPAIEYTELAKGYWCQFPKDQRHTVLIRKGVANLYQVDLTRHTAAIKEYRQAHH